ncbi:hypothetical protein D3C78_1425950 [compost metagenome]
MHICPLTTQGVIVLLAVADFPGSVHDLTDANSQDPYYERLVFQENNQMSWLRDNNHRPLYKRSDLDETLE